MTTVAPIRDIVESVGGDRIDVVGLVPEGTNSHTFEPPPSAARDLATADLVLINGLNLELPALELARVNAPPGVEILLLGEAAVSPGEYIFDFSFPEDRGSPNPHLWTDPNLAIRYAELIADALVRLDPSASDYYQTNLRRFRERIDALDAAIVAVVATIPPSNRVLLTYHDSFPYFGLRYGLRIIGVIQPSDFSDPSPRELARLIEQIRDQAVPAIFGSAVFRSDALDRIAGEAGAIVVSTLRDDDLPGEPEDADNTYVAMMVENVQALSVALGGDNAALDGFPVENTWLPYDQFTSN